MFEKKRKETIHKTSHFMTNKSEEILVLVSVWYLKIYGIYLAVKRHQ